MTTGRKPNHAEEESAARQMREAAKEFGQVVFGLAQWSDRFDKQLERLEKIASRMEEHSHV